MLDFLSSKVEAFIADAAVSGGVVGGVLGACIADSVDFDEPSLAKTAASEPILIEPTNRRHENLATLVGSVVDFIFSALGAASIDDVVAIFADAGLLFEGVGLVFSAPDQNA